MQSRARQAGFTPIEIAVVLVIIGLLPGVILNSQKVITQARIKNIVDDFNGITAAYFAYQGCYRAVPRRPRDDALGGPESIRSLGKVATGAAS